MSTIIQDALMQGYSARFDMNGHTFQTLDDAGAIFDGLITTAPPVDPRMELGQDTREMSLISVISPAPANIRSQTKLIDTVTQDKWTVIKRESNPADFTDKFWVVKIVTGKDS